jgi:hypothetical protein
LFQKEIGISIFSSLKQVRGRYSMISLTEGLTSGCSAWALPKPLFIRFQLYKAWSDLGLYESSHSMNFDFKVFNNSWIPICLTLRVEMPRFSEPESSQECYRQNKGFDMMHSSGITMHTKQSETHES